MDTVESLREEFLGDNELLCQILDKAADGLVVTSPLLKDNPIIYVSAGFEKLTGYNFNEIVGKNCRFLQDEDNDQEVISIIKQALQDGRSFSGSIINYKKNGEQFINYLRLEPITDKFGDVRFFIGSQVDMTNVKQPKIKT